MQDRDHAKVLALLVGVAALAVAVARCVGVCLPAGWGMGVGSGATWYSRLLHPLFHVSLLHAVLNVYVLWQVVFFFDVGKRQMVLALAVACSCPASVASWPYTWIYAPAPQPSVVGLSGFVFALVGMVLPLTSFLRYGIMLLLWQVPGLCFGTVAVGMHLYCFVVGLVVARACRLIRRR